MRYDLTEELYLVLDCETATLPYCKEVQANAKVKKNLSTTFPLIYDIAWLIGDKQGNILTKKNFLIAEVWGVPQIFETAYYKNKKPLYVAMIQRGKIQVASWVQAQAELLKDLENALACAFNGMFDFKKAIPFTEKYINSIYGGYYDLWLQEQKEKIDNIVANVKKSTKKQKLEPQFILNGQCFKMVDIWQVACQKLINNNSYKKFCLDYDLLGDSKLWFKTNAETTYKYLSYKYNFVESHTALKDCEIEYFILCKALKKGIITPTLECMPFRQLGSTVEFVEKFPQYAPTLYNELSQYLEDCKVKNKAKTWITQVTNNIARLEILL